MIFHIECRSRVSYRISSRVSWNEIVVYETRVSPCKMRFSSRETSVASSPRKTRFSSRETSVASCETQWSVHFGINYKQLACKKTNNFSRRGKVYSARAFGYLGCCVMTRFKRTNSNLSKKHMIIMWEIQWILRKDSQCWNWLQCSTFMWHIPFCT